MPANQKAISAGSGTRAAVGALAFIGYAATIPLANYLIMNVGTVCHPRGPCTVPVWPGIECPSGSLLIGWALVLRDIVQRTIGKAWALLAITLGVIVSGLVAPASLIIASMAAFGISELCDFLIYTRLQRDHFIAAVLASSVVGLVIDSAIFLFLAFGSLELLSGLIIGKTWMVLAALPALFWVRRRYKEDAT